MRIFLLLATSCLIFAACDDDGNNNKVVIKTGKECGWCGGIDSLVITKSSSDYIFNNPCEKSMGREVHEKTVSKEWHELLSALNWNEFTQVNVNTCALCADGCDTWIWIQNGDSVHQIRFTENSPEVESIRTFVEKLGAYHEKFRTK